jgi:hypothetical protein
VLAVETTQWVMSLGSALVELALASGLKDWFFRVEPPAPSVGWP